MRRKWTLASVVVAGKAYLVYRKSDGAPFEVCQWRKLSHSMRRLHRLWHVSDGPPQGLARIIITKATSEN
jgi:hypothetical protein